MRRIIAYVSCSESREIQVFSIDPQCGMPELIQRTGTPGLALPLKVRQDRRILYAGTRSENRLLALRIEPESGLLELAGSIPAPGGPTYVATDHAVRVLFCASYRDNLLAVFPLDAGGVPQVASQIETGLDKAHCAQMDATNRWLLVPTLGADAIRSYRLQDGQHLIPADPQVTPVRTGSGPRHLVFSPDNRHVHCLNELDGSVDTFDFDPASGRLAMKQSISLLPPGFSDAAWAAELRAAPDGRFLYATERRSSTLTFFAVDRESGNLTLLGHTPTETQPRGMAVTACGCWLLAAGELSDHMAVYALDPETGWPSLCHRVPTGRAPICIETATL